jgi:phosphoribosylformylglycinamidine synthase
MVGELPDPARAGGRAFAREGDAIALLGPFSPSLAGSELAKLRGELGAGLPEPEIAAVDAACATVREAVRDGKLSSAHDVSDGGLACALAECAIAAGIGCRVDLQPLRERGCAPEAALFGEGAGGFVLSGGRETLESLAVPGVEVHLLGKVGGERLDIAAGELALDISIDDARSAWSSLPAQVETAS